MTLEKLWVWITLLLLATDTKRHKKRKRGQRGWWVKGPKLTTIEAVLGIRFSFLLKDSRTSSKLANVMGPPMLSKMAFSFRSANSKSLILPNTPVSPISPSSSILTAMLLYSRMIRDKQMLMTSPVSMSMMMTAKKEPIHKIPSSFDLLANFGKSCTCMNMPFKATTMMADRTA